MPLQPGRRVDQKRETGCVAFWETVAAEALDLGKTPLGEIRVIAVLAHAAQEPGAEIGDIAVLLEGGKGPAQAVGLFWGEPRAHDRDLHRLFLEQAMQIAIVGAGFTPEEADRLRRALATFKKHGNVSEFRNRFLRGMRA